MKSSGSTESVWMSEVAETSPENTGSLSENCVDACVVGAGIAGLSVAYELSLAGKSVIVLDDGPIGGGETFRTTAHLVNALDDRYYELEKLHTVAGARLAAESHTRAIDRIEEIVTNENIDCEFTRLDGYLFSPPAGDRSEIDRELEACHRVGLTDVAKVERAPIADFDTGPALRFPKQAQFHIAKYLLGLAKAVQERGGKIHCGEEFHVTSVTGGAKPKVKIANGQEISAGAIAVCTNTPINDLVAVHTKQMPYRTYVMAAHVAQGTVNRALYWDSEDPYHYVRLMNGAADPSGDLLIVGGEDHKTGQEDNAEERFSKLESWARERWPGIGEVEFKWSGQVMEPDDGMAFIGKNPLDEPNIYIATGDSGNGMTHGVIAGILLSDLIHGRSNPWAKLYEPRRIRLRATGEWMKENLNTFAQYSDHVTAGDAASANDIPPGHGAIVRHGMKKLACYRDEAGKLHTRSATCPHLAAVVQWNSAEKTWDCPAHGSRFDAYGCVVNGPANSDLSREESGEQAA